MGSILPSDLFLNDAFYKIKDPEGSPEDKQDISCKENLCVLSVKTRTYMDHHEDHQRHQNDCHEGSIEYFQSFVSHKSTIKKMEEYQEIRKLVECVEDDPLVQAADIRIPVLHQMPC